MLKYSKVCERSLMNDNFNSCKKSTCKECVKEKVECKYCENFFDFILSSYTKQMHCSAYN